MGVAAHPRWPGGDPDAVARAILARPEYGDHASSQAKPSESIWQLAWDWIVDHVVHPLFGPISHAVNASKGAGTVVGLVLIAFAIAGLGFVLFRLVMAFVPRFARADAAAANARALDAFESHDDWLAAARSAAARGDYRAAIGALFAAALAELDDRAIVTYDAARTPGEYRRLVRRARDAAAPPFDELAERFVRATYAQELPARADFEAAERALVALEPLVRA